MKYIIERTSCYSGSEQPCDGASIFTHDDRWDETKWSIEINSLEELMALADKEGELIVAAPCEETYNMPSIEIYDTYRE